MKLCICDSFLNRGIFSGNKWAWAECHRQGVEVIKYSEKDYSTLFLFF